MAIGRDLVEFMERGRVDAVRNSKRPTDRNTKSFENCFAIKQIGRSYWGERTHGQFTIRSLQAGWNERSNKLARYLAWERLTGIKFQVGFVSSGWTDATLSDWA